MASCLIGTQYLPECVPINHDACIRLLCTDTHKYMPKYIGLGVFRVMASFHNYMTNLFYWKRST